MAGKSDKPEQATASGAGENQSKMADSELERRLLTEHRRTWHAFVRLITFSAVGTALVLALMAIFLL